MYNSRNIIIGLVIFVLAVTSPFLLNIGKENLPPVLNLDTPVINQLHEKQCVESAEFMRTNHPQLLIDWRDQVVREGQTIYVSNAGIEYEMGLETNCLQCHSNKSQFCDSCHTYADVDPYCWDCHNDTKGAGL